MIVPAPLRPLHTLWRLLPVRQRRRLFDRVTAAMTPRPDRWPPPAQGGLAVAGEVMRASGLGEGARLMHLAVQALGLPAYLVDAGQPVPGEQPDASLAAEMQARGLHATLPRGVPLVIHVNAPMMAWSMIRLGRRLIRGRRVIGYWAWELPSVPPEWARGLRFVHEIWTPSRFAADAIATLPGVAARGIPIRVVHHPLTLAPPRASPLGRGDFGLPESAVVVLVSFNMASSFVRKNPLGAIAAFRQAFGGRADRLLVVKLLNEDQFPADYARLREAVAGAGNIRLETRPLPAADAHALTACADIVLSLHRSEGFGLVPAEAMLLGRAVVATGWSGNMEYMDADSAALVGWTLVPVVDPRGVYSQPGAVWAEPDVNEAAAHLVRLADDPAARRALGAQARLTAHARLGAGSLAAALRGMGLSAGAPSGDASARDAGDGAA